MRAEMSRSPREAPTPRMEALARLPIFLQLENKRAVLVGGGAGAAWKAELLSAAGARVDVYVEAPSEELLALAAQAPRGPIVVHARKFTAADLEGTAIAVGALEGADAASFAAAARRSRGRTILHESPSSKGWLRRPLRTGNAAAPSCSSAPVRETRSF